jgi:hypothetical protein
MYQELNSQERALLERIFEFKPKDQNSLKDVLKKLQNKRIRFDKNETYIEKFEETAMGEKDWVLDKSLVEEFQRSFGKTRRGRLLILAMYEKQRYLILKTNLNSDSLWFFPLNSQSVRYLGHFYDEGFCDKSYPDYFKAFVESQKKTKEPLGLLIWESILNGYDPKKFSTLPRDAQKLVHDTIGIFLAEEFRMKTRGSTTRLLHISPGSIVIATYLAHGGRPLSNSPKSKEDKEIAEIIPISHKEFVKALPLYDKTISKYIKNEHPNLHERIVKDFDLDICSETDINILQKLLYAIEKSPKDRTKLAQQLKTLREFFEAIQSGAKKM